MSSEHTQRLCLFGAGAHGRVVAHQARSIGVTDLCFADNAAHAGSSVDGIPVLFSDLVSVTDRSLLITVGDNGARQGIFDQSRAIGHDLSQLVVEPARVFSQHVGEGTMVLAGAFINIGATLGRNIIVNSGAIVEHDAVIGDHCHLAPGSVVGGGARIGSGVLLGSNATALPGVTVCDWAVIGAGAVVCENINERGTYVGVPARKIQHKGPTR
ncbi:NeuD/PglB/VioB family sugar acetyltransferase [Roseobacter cerasinus]|nr:NeuD/PglB/VioB family sugar acetyltransferase [Roseobacter cerasinus]